MRIDKFLKLSLLFKTRSSGEKLIEEDRILLNGKVAKSASSVKPGDILVIKYIDRTVTCKILLILDKNVSKDTARTMYEILNEEHNELYY